MMLVEQNAYKHNRDSIMNLYPGTFSADVLCRFFDLHAPAQGKDIPATLKAELLTQTPWQVPGAYNDKTINRIARLYLDYGPDTGLALKRSIQTLLNRTQPGSVARNRLANALFDIFTADIQDDGLKQFTTLCADSAGLFTDDVLKEKCRRYAKIMPGEKAPEIFLPDSSGQEISLQRVAANHTCTLLLLWDPDCPHCIASMPALIEIYKKYHAKGLEIFAVSLNSDKTEWLAAIKKNKCNWLNVRVDEMNKSQPEDYFITYTPRLVLIDKRGIIIQRQVQVDELEEALKLAFKI
jgi:peroxiredoxin